MFYRYDTTRHRAFFGYHGKQSFADAPSRADGLRIAFVWLRLQLRASAA